ncbi:MAG: UPF0236 family protein, partial [Bacilli bacterium]|nr:UPF0236 family protein [Bacilli bacterium]
MQRFSNVPNQIYPFKLSSEIFNNLKKEVGTNELNPIFNYINFLSNLDDSICTIAKNSLVSIFESIDKAYCSSLDRKHKYHVKAHLPRTILTVFGEITFMRTFYSNKDNKGSFCYLDRFLGLKKHDYFDPYIKATIVEFSANNSVPTVCSMINELIGNKIKLKDKFNYINRQTVRNIILDSKISNPPKKELDSPETIYIIADEKWCHTQNNNHEPVMIKSIVVFDSIKSKPRRYLNNKRIFAGFRGKKFLDNTLDYLYYTYDLDKVKNIIIMGDGAKWIKSLTYHFKVNHSTNVIFALDKFHFKQAIHHICLDKDLEAILHDFVINNNKLDFILACDNISAYYPHRHQTIEDKKTYILNNWSYIKNLYDLNLSCPMESQISHNLAYL